jgi:hypothetical protein
MDRSGDVYFINVGANAITAGIGIRSPIFDDGKFEFMPIPESRERPRSKPFDLAAEGNGTHPQLLRYRDITCFNDKRKQLVCYLPKAVHEMAVHNDPEFETYTYGGAGFKQRLSSGQLQGGMSKSSKLLRAKERDNLFFIANLTRYTENDFVTNQGGFFLIGYLKIELFLDLDLLFSGEIDGRLFPRISHNAHVRQFLASGDSTANHMRVFVGLKDQSQRFPYAVPITRKLCDHFLKDASGRPWKWADNKTEMQTIGSYTRTNRCFLSPGVPHYEAFWEHISEFNSTPGYRF